MFSPDGTLISASAAPHCGVDPGRTQRNPIIYNSYLRSLQLSQWQYKPEPTESQSSWHYFSQLSHCIRSSSSRQSKQIHTAIYAHVNILDGSNRVRNITINPNGTGRVRNSIPLDRSSRVILSRRVLPLPGQVGTVDLPIQDHVLSISLKSFSCCSPAVNNLSKR